MLLRYDQLPAWLHDNDSVVTGYRIPQSSFWSCIRSLFALHNETVNIWTHLAGGVLASFYLREGYYSTKAASLVEKLLQSPFRTFSHPLSPSSITTTDGIYFSIFLTGACFCLFSSATFHLFTSHSESVHKGLNRLDHLAIVVLIVSSFYPAIFYGFYCDSALRNAYLTMITTFGIAAAYTIFAPKYRTKEARRTRAYIFIALGSSAVVPILHALWRDGYQKANTDFAINWLVLEGALYIAGALLYAERVPERLFPGQFDIIGASHQIFHVLVLLAAYTHYLALVKSFQRRHFGSSNFC